MIKALCIDDNPDSLPFGEDAFEQVSLNIVNCPFSAIDEFKSFNPDLLIIDYYMPFKDGKTLAKELLELKDIPVIFISHDTSSDTVLDIFQEGSQDFINKDMNLGEIEARILNVLNKQNKLLFKNYSIDTVKRELTFCDKKVTLTPLETTILSVVFKKDGNIEKQKFIQEVWGDVAVVDKSLGTHLTNLRKKIVDLNANVKISRSGFVKFEKVQ